MTSSLAMRSLSGDYSPVSHWFRFKSAGTAGNTPEEPIMQLEKLRFGFSLNTVYLRLIAKDKNDLVSTKIDGFQRRMTYCVIVITTL